MKTIKVEIPTKIEKSFGDNMTYTNFVYTIDKLEENNWVDTKLEKPMKMEDFALLLKSNK